MCYELVLWLSLGLTISSEQFPAGGVFRSSGHHRCFDDVGILAASAAGVKLLFPDDKIQLAMILSSCM